MTASFGKLLPDPGIAAGRDIMATRLRRPSFLGTAPIMKTIDADAHVLEIPYSWEFIDEAEKAFTPMVVTYSAGQQKFTNEGNVEKEFWVIDGRIQPKEANVGAANTTQEAREMRDIDARLKHMDELEIDVQVLYPTLFLRPITLKAPVEMALVKSYNRWLAEIWKKGKGRLRWVAMPPLLSMDKVRDELAWCKDNGACGIFMRGLECERVLSDPYFDPLYKAAEELDLSVCLHSGTNAFEVHDFFAGDSGFNRFKLAVVGAFHTLIMDGMPAKFPKIRWGFVEVSAQWIPYVMNDLGLRFKRRGRRIGTMKDYNLYVACQVTDDIADIIKISGEDNLVVGTDYGHHDTSTEIEALRLLKQNGKVSPAVVDKILGPNAARLYGLS
jgi:predicted TIM-barrel fold metal-dependent hydrolase